MSLLASACSSGNVEHSGSVYEQGQVGDELAVFSWNVGYGGLGAESDFFKDLGTQTRPPSATVVDSNIDGIVEAILQSESDIYLFQEMAQPSYVNYQRDLLAKIKSILPTHSSYYSADFRTSLLPAPFNLSIGNATFSRLKSIMNRIVLEDFTERHWLVVKRDYSVHRLRLDGEAHWTVINLHLSAFDDNSDAIRERQATEVMEIAMREYAEDRCVVIGGDWNMRLIHTGFPHNTDKRFLFWIRDILSNIFPVGWKWAIDPSVPTVRTLNKPYILGENYTTIVDGWLVSPNVTVKMVKTIDTGFRFSDHNPVILTVSCQRPQLGTSTSENRPGLRA